MHKSLNPDLAVWRLSGTPLVSPSGHGALDGATVAVKDLFAVEGQPIGAGNPAWLEQAPPELSNAPVVAALLAAGAAVAGIAQTDEFAYSLAGTNGHYGTPPNPKAPDRIPGGSSSGSASAVSLGGASIGLGTDTAGSIRIPASYQGLYGLRTSHGAIARDGLLPLAPSFDAIGWLTRSRQELVRVAEVLTPRPRGTVSRAVFADTLLELADADVATALRHALGRWDAPLPIEPIAFDTDPLDAWVRAFQVRQGWEAWQAHGAWVSRNWGTLNPDVRARFELAAARTDEDLAAADAALTTARAAIENQLGDAVLILPSASSLAPLREMATLGGEVIEDIRARTFALTCLAGISGRPAVSSPLPVTGPPVGICAVGPRGSDLALAAFEIG